MANPSLQVNPKLALMRKVCAKLAPQFRRQFGEMVRVQANPVHGPRLFDDTRAGLLALMKEELEAAGAPVVLDGTALPEGPCWVVEPVSGRRNFLHARAPVSINLAYLENGEVLMGGVYDPLTDLLAYVQPRAGVMGPDRLRVAGRTELTDTLLMLPFKTVDCVEMKLLEKYDGFAVHTRKSGHPLADVLDVAAGRADAAIATRLTPLEALLAKLIMAEAAGVVTDLDGAPLGAASTRLLASSPKLHAKFLDALK